MATDDEAAEQLALLNLLRGFGGGHQVLFLVARELYGRKQGSGLSACVSVAEAKKTLVVTLAKKATDEGLLVQTFHDRSGQPPDLSDSLELTSAGRKWLGNEPAAVVPVKVKPPATKKRAPPKPKAAPVVKAKPVSTLF